VSVQGKGGLYTNSEVFGGRRNVLAIDENMVFVADFLVLLLCSVADIFGRSPASNKSSVSPYHMKKGYTAYLDFNDSVY